MVTDLNVDSQGALIWGKDRARHAKHVSIRKKFVHENVEKGNIKLLYCTISSIPADILTKPLLRVAFEHHRRSFAVERMDH